MKTLLFNIILICSLIEHCHGNSVDEALQAIAADLPNDKQTVAKVKSIQSSMPAPEVVREVMSALMANHAAAQDAAGVRFLLAMDPFPFDELTKRYSSAQSSLERGVILRIFDLHFDFGMYQSAGSAKQGAGTGEQIRILKTIAISALADTDDAYTLDAGENESGASPERVCDIGYNILVTILSLQTTFPRINRNNDEHPQRDILIDHLRTYLKTHQEK